MSHKHHTKLGMSGVTYKKNFYFHNEEKLKDWLKSNMTHPSHRLFVDIMSFSNFFVGNGYIECSITHNDLYLTNKIGYATMADSIVATLFQNILPPAAYGQPPDVV
jgi:hypothetical protein